MLNLPYQYAYFTICLVLVAFWLLIFIWRRDLRREMLWASFMGLPFGIIDYFLVPDYWNPDSLFGLIGKYGVGLESFLFLFLVAGLSAVLYEFLIGRKLKKAASPRRWHILPLLISSLTFFILIVIMSSKAIYNFMAAGAVGMIATVYWRRDLWRQVVWSAFVFSLLYFLVLLLVNQIFNGWVYDFYSLKNMWGIMILGVPLEEIAAVFFAGAFWSTAYEYIKGYREYSRR